MEKTLLIDGKEVRMRASAAMVRLYRFLFRRELLGDMQRLSDAYQRVIAAKPEDMEEDEYTNGRMFEIVELEVFENVAYTMARMADPEGVPNDVMEWMDQFEAFSIHQHLGEVLELWTGSLETKVKPKKK